MSGYGWEEFGLMPIILNADVPRKSGLIIGKPNTFTKVFINGKEGRHSMSDAIRATDHDEYRKERMKVNVPKVDARNKRNALEFLRVPPKTPGEFFTVKANYLWHECTWHYLTLEEAYEDALDDCDPVSITGPSGVTVTDFMNMTVEQVRFILDGNHAALSDGAL
jgi:hypothetical protein